MDEPKGATAGLRQQAEGLARKSLERSLNDLEAQWPEDKRVVLQELRVHQIELEMQNEELRRAQLDLDAERARYFVFYNLAPVGYLTLSDTGKILEANLTAAKMLNISKSTLEGQAISLLISPEDQDCWYRNYHQLVETGETQAVELRMAKRKGPVFWALLEATLEHGPGGTKVGRIVINDITEHKRAEEVAREREQRYRDLFARADEGILIASPDGALVEVNDAFARMHGYRPEEMLPMTLKDLDTPETAAKTPERMRRLLAGEALTFEVEHYHRDGHVFPLEVSASLITSGGSSSLLCFHRDITTRNRLIEERRILEAQLLQTQKMESLGNLAGGVAHDMNNALAAILGSAEAEIEALPQGSAVHEAFENIIKASLRAKTLVQGLLAFARKGLSERHELNLNDLVREEVQLLEHTTLARVQFAMELAPDLRCVRGDSAALSHALMNLCVNAIDAMDPPPGNRLLTLRTRNAGKSVELEVEDRGSGMSKEVLAKALEPFFTTKAQGKGTGLGLSIVYGTVKAHSGEMELRSHPGRGTCVLLRFPASPPSAIIPEEEAEPLSHAAHAPHNVLLVDDDILVRNSLTLLLNGLGHTVTVASSGEDAVAKLESGGAFDVVILDLNMPGMGGEGTLPLIRALRPTLPVLLATGRVEELALDLVRTHSHVTLLPKPFGLGELRWYLEQLV